MMSTTTQGPDMTREYRTRSGDRAIIHGFTPRNALGNIVTFPIKMTVINKDHPRRKKHQIVTLEGRCRALGEHKFDIVDMPPVLLSPPSPCTDCCGMTIAPPKPLA